MNAVAAARRDDLDERTAESLKLLERLANEIETTGRAVRSQVNIIRAHLDLHDLPDTEDDE